jgi:hypothetical protein
MIKPLSALKVDDRINVVEVPRTSSLHIYFRTCIVEETVFPCFFPIMQRFCYLLERCQKGT